jgi:GNAT superfamily N-acetyltransferase
VAAIARVHVVAWQVAFGRVFDPARLADIDVAERTAMWKGRLAGASGNTLVAEADGSVVGFVSFGASRDEDAVGAGEIWALYVAPLYWGSGDAAALLAAAVDCLREQRFVEAVLWTLGDYPRGRRFYEREGWLSDGATKPLTLLDREVEVVRYRRSL